MQFLKNTVEIFRLPTQIKISEENNKNNNNNEVPSIAEKVG